MTEKLPEETLSQLFEDKKRINLEQTDNLPPEVQERIEKARKTQIIALFGAGMGIPSGLPMGWGAKNEVEK